MKKLFLALVAIVMMVANVYAADHKGISYNELSSDRFTLIENGNPISLLLDETDDIGVQIAAKALQNDFKMVSGKEAKLLNEPSEKSVVIIGTLESKYIKQIIKSKKIDKKELEGKYEKYIMTTIANPIEGVEEALVIAGSDKRGAIYGIYELSEQIGVSPW